MRTSLLLTLGLAMAGCGPSAPTLAGGKPVDYWLESLTSPDAKLRKTAAFKLGNVGPSDPRALPALIAALADGNAQVRRELILALAKFGPEATPAVPTLSELARADTDAMVRDFAARAIERIESPVQSAKSR